MSVESFVETIVGFVRDHQSWAAPVAFLVAFGESIAFLSLVWPGTAILVAISALLAASGVSTSVLAPAIIAAGLGGSVGYAASYWIGLHFKDSIPRIWPFRSHPDLIPRGQRFFEKYGAFGIFLGHFFGPVRAVIPVVAGMFAMRQIPFQIANIASAFIWAAGVIAPSFLAVSFKDEIYAALVQFEPLVVALVFVLALGNAVPHMLLFWPTLILFVAVGFLELLAGGKLWPLLLAGTCGAFVGDALFYWLNKGRAESPGASWYVDEESDTLEQAGKLIDRWGPIAVVVSKALGMKRASVPLVAGVRDMQLGPFLAASAFSALLWAAVLLAAHPIYAALAG